jgi:hypothetical protein
MWHVCIRILVGYLREREHLEDPGLRMEDNIKMDVQEMGWETWSVFIWFRIWAGGGLL